MKWRSATWIPTSTGLDGSPDTALPIWVISHEAIGGFRGRNVWAVEKLLIDMPHTPLKTSNARYERMLRKFLAFKKAHPNKPYTNYEGSDAWM